MKSRVMFVVLLISCTASLLFAQRQHRDASKELAIERQLEAVNPPMVKIFHVATEALDNNAPARADSLYAIVAAAAPAFDPAVRRRGAARLEMGDFEAAKRFSAQAIQMNRSADNLFNLAVCLMTSSAQSATPVGDLNQAYALLTEAQRLPGGDEADFYAVRCHVTLMMKLERDFRNAVQEFRERYPNDMLAHYYSALLNVREEHWTAAEEEILEAKRLGLQADIVQHFLDSGVHTNALVWRIFAYGLWGFGLWSFGLGALFLTGKLLSNMTLKSIDEADPNLPISQREKTLRRLYRFCINSAGIYYYISLPFVCLLVLGVATALFYFFLLIGRVPIQLMAFITIGAAVTVFKMFQSLFIKVPDAEPGRLLRREEAPGLWNLTQEVAAALSTRPIDEIRLTPGTELAVYEKGTRRQKQRDEAERVLLVGAAVLNDFRQSDFRAVLAHEYGHFSHRDTAGGEIALRVRGDMSKFFYALVLARQATRLNLAIHFLRLYDFIFRRMSHGAARLQEILADRVAAQTYGVAAFTNGLTHALRRSIEFQHIVLKEYNDAKKQGRAFCNLYELTSEDEGAIGNELKKAFCRQTTEDDTHPAPVDRLRLIEGIRPETVDSSRDMMWDLFTDKDRITAEMTALIGKANPTVEVEPAI